MQYREGVASVINGSDEVVGTGVDWSNIPRNSLFAIPGQPGIYRVAAVVTPTEVRLTSPWAGQTAQNQTYWITADFTPFHSFPIPGKNDIETTRVLEEALLMIDQALDPAPFGQFSVKSRAVTATPDQPGEGDAYVVPPGATGAWSNQVGKIAIYRRGAWTFSLASDGAFVRVDDESKFYFYVAATNVWQLNPLTGNSVDRTGDTMSGALRFVEGSPAAPGAAFGTGTGLYKTGTNAFGAAVGGTNAIEFLKGADGKVKVIVRGDAIFEGSTFTTQAQTVNIEDNFVTLNSAVAGTPSLNAGINVRRGTALSAQIMWDETFDIWRVGLTDAPQAIATRQDNPTVDGIAVWNNAARRFDTSSALRFDGTDLFLNGNKLATEGANLDAATLGGATLAQVRDYNSLLNKPTAFPTDWSLIANKPASLSADWNTLANKPAAFPSDWSQLSSIPAVFAPAPHSHSIVDVIGLQGALDAKLAVASFTWAELPDKPSTFAPSAHTHVISEVTGLQSVLDRKLETTALVWGNLGDKPATFTPSAHTHSILEVLGLQTALDGKLSAIAPTITGSFFGDAVKLRKPEGSELLGDVQIDIAANTLRFFESGGALRGVSVDLTSCGSQSRLWHTGNLAAPAIGSTANTLAQRDAVGDLRLNSVLIDNAGALKNDNGYRLAPQGAGGNAWMIRGAHAASSALGLQRADGTTLGYAYAEAGGANIGFFSAAGAWRLQATSTGDLYAWDDAGAQRQALVAGRIPVGQWLNTLDGKNRLHFANNGTSYYGSPLGHEWRTAGDISLMTLDQSGQLLLSKNWVVTQPAYGHKFLGINNTYYLGADSNGLFLNQHAADAAGGAYQLTPLTVRAEGVRAYTALYAAGEFYCGGWLRVQGPENGIYWEQYGGGWYMYETGWLRAYGGKNVYTPGWMQMGGWTVESDARQKSDIVPLTGSAEIIDRTNVYEYTKGGRRLWGVLAQDALKVAPLLVHDSAELAPDGSPYLTVDYNGYIPHLIAETRSLRQRVAELERLVA